MQKSLTKTLVFQLQPGENGQQLLNEAFLEARRIDNETIRRAKNGEDRGEIRQDLESDADYVNNTAQLVVQKSFEAMENYYEYDDYNQPSYTKDGAYPLRSNHKEGYNLFLEDDCIRFRVSAKPYNPVKDTLRGSSDEINPEYTSQACSLTECEHTTRSNRRGKRFKSRECGRQDQADRNAAINIAKKGVEKLDRNEPALNNLPQVRKVSFERQGLS